jgi:hypothetical protein
MVSPVRPLRKEYGFEAGSSAVIAFAAYPRVCHLCAAMGPTTLSTIQRLNPLLNCFGTWQVGSSSAESGARPLHCIPVSPHLVWCAGRPEAMRQQVEVGGLWVGGRLSPCCGRRVLTTVPAGLRSQWTIANCYKMVTVWDGQSCQSIATANAPTLVGGIADLLYCNGGDRRIRRRTASAPGIRSTRQHTHSPCPQA